MLKIVARIHAGNHKRSLAVTSNAGRRQGVSRMLGNPSRKVKLGYSFTPENGNTPGAIHCPATLDPRSTKEEDYDDP